MNTFVLLCLAGTLAGAMNAVAGGGSFVTLPVLLWAGVPSACANASSTVALLPGSLASTWAYRDDLTSLNGLPLRTLLVTSVAGGLVGAVLLLRTPSRAFDAFIPWLLLLATVAFVAGPSVGKWVRRHVQPRPRGVLATQFVLAIYGGYFGGAVGIMMMAVWGLLGAVDLRAANPAKTLLVAATNAVAVVCFIVADKVWWPQTLALLGSSVMGGYGAARLARRLDARGLRRCVSALSILVTLAFFLRHA
ncbi:sulfite exporter TauE/SafE family protein [Corallococcus sp. H22C18031201]|nr:sulfite exporter TauE/SafE family protein [Corallococcus sp. H22C18031201]